MNESSMLMIPFEIDRPVYKALTFTSLALIRPPCDTAKANEAECIVEFVIVAIAFSEACTALNPLRIKTLLRVFFLLSPA